MTRHIGSSDSTLHGLTNRSGQLCEHRAPTILYKLHLYVQLSFNVVCQVYSMFMPDFSQLATVRGIETGNCRVETQPIFYTLLLKWFSIQESRCHKMGPWPVPPARPKCLSRGHCQ